MGRAFKFQFFQAKGGGYASGQEQRRSIQEQRWQYIEVFR